MWISLKENYARYKCIVIGHTPPLKYRSRRRPRRRSSHKPPLGTAARAEGSDQLQCIRTIHPSFGQPKSNSKVGRVSRFQT